jgi:phosphate-selective porin OprO/OprP
MSHRLLSVAALLAALPMHAAEVAVSPTFNSLAQAAPVRGAPPPAILIAQAAAGSASKSSEAATLAALADRLSRIEQRLDATAPASSAGPSEDLGALNQRLLVLERKLEIAQDDAATKATTTPAISLNEKGLGVKTPDGNFEIKLHGNVQVDQRTFIGDDAVPQNDTFLLRLLRPSLEGSFGPLVGFRLTPDFAGDNATIVDAYVDLRFDPRYTVRIGKFTAPIGLERLESSSATPLIERGFPTELAPNRDIGVQLQGDLASSRVNYAVGVFNGTPDGRDSPTVDADNNVEFEGRVFLEPWKKDANALSGLGFGLAGSVGDKEGSGNNFLPRYRTPGQSVFFNYRSAVAADGRHQRFSPQAYYYRNALGLLGEYITSRQDVWLPGNDASRANLTNRAWQLTGSWVLTGEDTGYRGVIKPNHPFVANGDGWGAVELTARYGELDIDDGAFPLLADPSVAASRARAWGLGINWYLNSNLKLVFNHTHASFDGGAPGGRDREDEKTFFSRVQVSF